MNFSLEIGPHTDLETLPPVKDVYVTMLPGGDYKETAKKSGDLVKKGFNPVPHFPSRSISDEAQLKDYISMCKDLGVKQALVIGGSRDPIGKFDSSIQILETGFFEGIKIGVAGHPEGSPDISDAELEKAMMDKKPYADYIVTQWLLNSQPIIDYISKQSVPVHVGITGPMKISSLIKFANIVGAKNSINFLKSNFTKALDLLKPKDPNELIGKVKEFTGNFHIYTFGGLKETNKWLKENGYVTEKRPDQMVAKDAMDFAEMVWDLTVIQTGEALIDSILDSRIGLTAMSGQGLAKQLIRESMKAEKDRLLPLVPSMTLAEPLVGIGAPARSYYAEVAKRLGTEYVEPKFAHVSNAVGAVAGGVAQRVTLTLTAPDDMRFRIHGAGEQEDLFDLEEALEKTRKLASTLAHERAVNAGAGDIEIRMEEEIRQANTGGSDKSLFIEATISANAIGRPNLG